MGHGLVSDNVIASRQLLYHALARVKDAVMKAPVTLKAKAAENAARCQGFRLCGHKATILKGDVPVFADKTLSAYETGKLEYVMERQKDILSKIRRQSRPKDFAMDSDTVSRHFIPGKGWDGDESIPWTVEDAWKDFGIVDFLGHDVTDVGELAAMWSIYNNPDIEYAHLVALKDGKVAYQMMFTSGLANAVNTPYDNLLEEFKSRIAESGCDSVYLIHNHPSASMSFSNEWMDHLGKSAQERRETIMNYEPSENDLEVAKDYLQAFGKTFKGSLVLADDVYTIIPPDAETIWNARQRFKAIAKNEYIRTIRQAAISKNSAMRSSKEWTLSSEEAAALEKGPVLPTLGYPVSPHANAGNRQSYPLDNSSSIPLWYRKFGPEALLAGGFRRTRAHEACLLLLGADMRIQKLIPVNMKALDSRTLQKVLDEEGAYAPVLITENRKDFEKLKRDFDKLLVTKRLEKGQQMAPLYDCLLVEREHVRSLKDEKRFLFDYEWSQGLVANRLKAVELKTMPKPSVSVDGIKHKDKANGRGR